MQIANITATPMLAIADMGKVTQRTAVAESVATNISVERADSPEAKAKAEATFRANLDLFVQASSTSGRMGKDASNVAKALVSTMQAMVINRPDLATKHFDFKLDQGTIKVVSQELSDKDKAWLESQLNGNSALLDAATSYHDHAVEGYNLWAKLDGQQIPQDQQATISEQADKLTSFLDLFQKIGANQKSIMLDGGTYYASNGAQISFDHDTKTAIGFLAFMHSAQASSDGSATWISPKGNTVYGAIRSDPFFQVGAIPVFAPAKPDSLGFHQTT